MSYATQQNLQDRYTEEFIIVATLEGSNAIDVTRVARALQDADAEINVYLAQRYDLPLNAPLDPLLEKLAGDIAMYLLPADGLERTEHSRQRYDDAIKLLNKIATGKATLRTTPVDGVETADPEKAQITSSPRLFDRQKMGKIT